MNAALAIVILAIPLWVFLWYSLARRKDFLPDVPSDDEYSAGELERKRARERERKRDDEYSAEVERERAREIERDYYSVARGGERALAIKRARDRERDDEYDPTNVWHQIDRMQMEGEF